MVQHFFTGSPLILMKFAQIFYFFFKWCVHTHTAKQHEQKRKSVFIACFLQCFICCEFQFSSFQEWELSTSRSLACAFSTIARVSVCWLRGKIDCKQFHSFFFCISRFVVLPFCLVRRRLALAILCMERGLLFITFSSHCNCTHQMLIVERMNQQRNRKTLVEGNDFFFDAFFLCRSFCEPSSHWSSSLLSLCWCVFLLLVSSKRAKIDHRAQNSRNDGVQIGQ